MDEDDDVEKDVDAAVRSLEDARARGAGYDIEREKVAHLTLMQAEAADAVPQSAKVFFDTHAADEDDAAGIEKPQDEFEKKHGIVKGLIAKPEDVISAPGDASERQRFHRRQMEKKDKEDLKTVHTAFVKGKWRQMRAKGRIDSGGPGALLGLETRRDNFNETPEDFLRKGDADFNEACVYSTPSFQIVAKSEARRRLRGRLR